MAKTWYPMINYEKCIECGSCTEMCEHGVYDMAKAPKPVVVYPEGCIEGCKGCGSRCPAEAIEYFGDNENCCGGDCCCGGECSCNG